MWPSKETSSSQPDDGFLFTTKVIFFSDVRKYMGKKGSKKDIFYTASFQKHEYNAYICKHESIRRDYSCDQHL